MMKAEQSFDEISIKANMQTKWAGNPVHFVRETDSTNRWAKDLAKQGAPHGTLCVADFQSAGRGRLGRQWTAPPGSSVMFSLLLRPGLKPEKAPALTLVMGLSVALAIKAFGYLVSIKWPNDVVINGKKICGILTEMETMGNEIGYVVIGTGINVDIRSFPPETQDKATSLALEGDAVPDRNQVLSKVLGEFEKNFELYEKRQDLSMLQESYEALLANRDQPVRVLGKDASFEGICLGINESGALKIRTASGEIRFVNSGEVSVRGLYSYV